MRNPKEKLLESFFRKRLEHCYDRGKTKKAILLGYILDRMQIVLLKEGKKPSCRFVEVLLQAMFTPPDYGSRPPMWYPRGMDRSTHPSY